MTMAQQLMQPPLRKVADLIGRMRGLARARQGGALRHLRDELYRITQGNDLSRVLPVELASLKDPLRSLDFGRRFLEGQLAQYDVKPLQREGRGPVLCAIDCSGSMQGGVDGMGECGGTGTDGHGPAAKAGLRGGVL